MKILAWNVQGLGSDVKLSVVRRVIRQEKLDMVLLQETKNDKVEDVGIRWLWVDNGFDFCFSIAEGRSRGILSDNGWMRMRLA
ncbi:hypothetical protein GQ457_11G030710 [Hibiscus cannabinus]